MNKSIKRILILTKRNLKEILRDPLSLIFLIALPLFMEILFYYLFHNLTTQFEMKYLAPGIVAFSQAFLTLFTGLLISLDRNTSFLTRLYVTETKSYEFIFGYTLSLLPITFIQSILFFLVGGIIDSSILSISIIPTILLSIITSLFFIGLGILFGSICNEKSIGGVASIVITAQSLLSAMWFPIEGLSENFIKVLNILPFKNSTMLLQNCLNNSGDIIKPILIMIGYVIVVFVIAIFTFKDRMKSK